MELVVGVLNMRPITEVPLYLHSRPSIIASNKESGSRTLTGLPALIFWKHCSGSVLPNNPGSTYCTDRHVLLECRCGRTSVCGLDASNDRHIGEYPLSEDKNPQS